jgi:hypothetical protein
MKIWATLTSAINDIEIILHAYIPLWFFMAVVFRILTQTRNANQPYLCGSVSCLASLEIDK